MNEDAAFCKVRLQVFRVLVVFVSEEDNGIDYVSSEEQRFV